MRREVGGRQPGQYGALLDDTIDRARIERQARDTAPAIDLPKKAAVPQTPPNLDGQPDRGLFQGRGGEDALYTAPFRQGRPAGQTPAHRGRGHGADLSQKPVVPQALFHLVGHAALGIDLSLHRPPQMMGEEFQQHRLWRRPRQQGTGRGGATRPGD
jgi:hypothetical protein